MPIRIISLLKLISINAMSMKNKILLLLFLPLLFGCNGWLNVTPQSEVDEEDLFADGEGYRNSLNGVYSRISESDMYAQQLTWGFMDVLAQYYNFDKMNQYGAYPKAYKGDYDNSEVKGILESIWQGAYKSIANCNNLIQNIDKADVTKFLGREGEKNMLKGEALALRAFLHFDLLRLFAPVAVELNGDKTGYVPVNDNNEYLPYCETHPAMFQKRENVQDYLDKVIRDLKDAKTLLATFDTVSSVRKDQLRTTNRLLGTAGAVEDLFYCFRGFRMNYYAATAMLARVYNYKGELQLAAEQAQEVIDNGSFPVKGDYAKPKQYEDVIFALSNRKLTELFEAYYTGTNKVLCVSNTALNKILGSDTYDYRGYYHMQNLDGANKVSKKYLPVSSDQGTIPNEIIPIIRTSEMQYIAGEYYASIKDYATAASRITVVKQASGAYTPVTVQSLEDYHKAWINDAYRTFIGEGQLFFLYKKLGTEFYSGMKDEAFVFAIPDSEDVTLNQ